ncbi:hypothetical protein ACXR0O_29675 [Verrucomicrobiota bacterium sgz303538]
MRIRTAIILCAALAIIGLASFFDIYAYSADTCLECRATREKRWICGIPLQWIAPNSYSRAVLASEPRHQHQWRYCGSRHSYSLVSVSYACGRQHPIWLLPVEVQAEYARLVSPAELHDALHAIDIADPRAADEAVNHIYEKVLDSR